MKKIMTFKGKLLSTAFAVLMMTTFFEGSAKAMSCSGCLATCDTACLLLPLTCVACPKVCADSCPASELTQENQDVAKAEVKIIIDKMQKLKEEEKKSGK